MPLDSREIAAQVAHEALSSLRIALGEAPLPPWAQAETWQKESTYALVDMVRAGDAPDATEDEHARWYDERAAKGWTYGPVRDDNAKVNPLLLPWARLSEEARRVAIAKTEVQIGVVEAITDAFAPAEE